MIPDSGTIFYEDEYGVIYDAVWETINGRLDITSITSQPFVWGMEPRGYILNNKVFRYGLVSVTRQVIDIQDAGIEEIGTDESEDTNRPWILRMIRENYEVIAEGSAYYFDYIQTSFACEAVPSDNFVYHLNSRIQDDLDIIPLDVSGTGT